MEYYKALKECIENGKKITRRDWNGRNMFVYYVPGRTIPLAFWKECNAELTEFERKRGYVELKGHFDMYNAQGERIIGWLASQTDMASDEWEIVGDVPKTECKTDTTDPHTPWRDRFD